MNDFVIADTNIISYIFKKDTRGNLYKPHLEGKVAIIAAQTLAELELLPLQNNWSKKRHDELRENLKYYTFIEANQEICLKWAKIDLKQREMECLYRLAMHGLPRPLWLIRFRSLHITTAISKTYQACKLLLRNKFYALFYIDFIFDFTFYGLPKNADAIAKLFGGSETLRAQRQNRRS